MATASVAEIRVAANAMYQPHSSLEGLYERITSVNTSAAKMATSGLKRDLA